MNLSGFSAVYPGYQAAENTQADVEKNQAAAKEAANKLLGAQVLGRALTGAQPPPAPNPGQPLAPPPGQASVPNAPSPGQVPTPQAPVPVQQAPPAAGPPGAPVAQGGGGLPEISLEALTKRILQTTPQVQGHPEILMAALERAAPLLDRQSKEDLAELRKKMQEQRLQQTGELAQARIEAAKAAEAGKQGRFDAREARLAASTAVRQDQGYQRLQLQADALAQRAQQTGDRQALGQWRATVDALHKRATEIIQSNSVNSNLSKADKDALLAEQRSAYEAQISAMRDRIGASTPTGGTAAPGAPAAPKVQGQVPQNAPLVTGGAPAADTPPLAMLKPGTITTFANGQKWTVGPDGQPKKVD
jgi:hypothetical protein